jgi:hypothetical protein
MAVGSPATIISPSVARLQHLVGLPPDCVLAVFANWQLHPPSPAGRQGPAAIAEGGRDQCDATLPRVRAQPAPLLGGPRRAFPPRVEYRAAIAADVAKGACDYDIPSRFAAEPGDHADGWNTCASQDGRLAVLRRIAAATRLQSSAMSSLLASSALRQATEYAFAPLFNMSALASRSISRRNPRGRSRYNMP